MAGTQPTSSANAPAKPPRGRDNAPNEPAASSKPDRLQKVLAHAGVGSRRACEELILQGRVTVNGQVVRELGTKVDPTTAKIALDGQKIQVERPVYYAVHKPKGYVSTNHDPAGKPCKLADPDAELCCCRPGAGAGPTMAHRAFAPHERR